MYRDGKTYLLWKQPIHNPTSIMIQELLPDGIHVFPGSKPKAILASINNNLSQKIQAPWVIFKHPYYYLFFSRNLYTSPDYVVSAARSKMVTGPFERMKGNCLEKDLKRYQARLGKAKFAGTG